MVTEEYEDMAKDRSSRQVSMLVKNIKWLVSLDSQRQILLNGAIAIDGETIVAIGKSNELEAQFNADKIVDGQGKLALPGFVEAHIHNMQQLGRGLADEVENPRWSAQRIYPYESVMMAEDAYISSLLCQIEMIKGGTTCFIDPGNYYPDETAKAALEIGMRGLITRSTFDISQGGFRTLPENLFRESMSEALAHAEDFVRRYPTTGDGLIQGTFSLRSLLNCSNELCCSINELACKYDTIIQSHAAFNYQEITSSLLQHGKRDLMRLNDLGILNERWVLVHMGWLSPFELTLVREYNIKVVLCPGASVHLAYGGFLQGLFPEMLELGITVALGSDAAAASNYVDMVRNMYMASGLFKEMRQNASIMPPEVVLEMATLYGARAARLVDQIGSIEIGKRADITLFDLSRPEWVPLFNPVANLVYSATGASADTVIINGKVIMEGRHLSTIDEAAVLQEAEERAQAISTRAKLASFAQPKWPVS
jgi:5-methylthioadenosine/S-adenosylhomocysteine deaminase